jgi:hypothetical protein
MKQLIVMISMIMLGIAIAGMITSFGDKAGTMSDNVLTSLDSVSTTVDTSGGK